MSNNRREINIPVLRDARTFEKRREEILTNLERNFTRSTTSPRSTTGSDTTASTLTTDTLLSGSHRPFHNDWDDEVNRWIRETRRRWDDDMRRMRHDMFALEPVSRLDMDHWGDMTDLNTGAGTSSLMSKMEREMQSLRKEMGSMSPFGQSRLGSSNVQQLSSSRMSSSTSKSSSDPRGGLFHTDVQESVKKSTTIDGVTHSSESSMHSSSTDPDARKIDFRTSALPSTRSLGLIESIKDAYEIGEDGQVHFKVHFDAKDFAPEDIDVTTVGNQLTVQAKKSTPSSKKEFCRTITLPQSIDHEHFQCNLTEDGVLILDAPVKAPDYNSITFTHDHQLGIRPKSEAQLSSVNTNQKSITLKSIGTSGATILKDGLNGRKLHVEVPIDPGYTADDLTVRMDSNKIVVSGRKQVKTSSTTGSESSSMQEFTRSFDVSETVDPLSVTSQLIDRLLIIEAPLLYSA